jgi:hypothetical protein
MRKPVRESILAEVVGPAATILSPATTGPQW